MAVRVGLLGTGDPVEVQREILERREAELPGVRHRAVVVSRDVPADDRARGDREPRQRLVGQQGADVRQWNREGEQVRARKVQVVRRLDHLVAEQGDELTRLQGETTAERDLIRSVRLLQVEVRRVPERELVVVAAESSQRVVLL